MRTRNQKSVEIAARALERESKLSQPIYEAVPSKKKRSFNRNFQTALDAVEVNFFYYLKHIEIGKQSSIESLFYLLRKCFNYEY
jgi:hypothetical protein